MPTPGCSRSPRSTRSRTWLTGKEEVAGWHHGKLHNHHAHGARWKSNAQPVNDRGCSQAVHRVEHAKLNDALWPHLQQQRGRRRLFGTLCAAPSSSRHRNAQRGAAQRSAPKQQLQSQQHEGDPQHAQALRQASKSAQPQQRAWRTSSTYCRPLPMMPKFCAKRGK